ncbi:MAG: hypothetical protein K6A38_07570 [Lachnospiraceae bacterium]|nr:hypothetical protein [Lachnospiraceae bacterium]
MKRKNLLMLCGFLLVTMALGGCKKNVEPATAPTVNEQSDNTGEANTQAANPMVEVKGADDFQNKLGIYLDPTPLGGEPKLFIYNDEMAEIQSSEPGMGDEDLEIRIRASKSADDISGVYDDGMQDVDGDFGDIDIKHRYSPETGTDIYDFTNDGSHYCVMITGEASQMQIAEIMDNALLACGVK